MGSLVLGYLRHAGKWFRGSLLSVTELTESVMVNLQAPPVTKTKC